MAVLVRSQFLAKGADRMVVRPIFSTPVPYSPRFSTISIPTSTVFTGLNVVPCLGAVYNLFYQIRVFWSDPTFLPRGHTKWPFYWKYALETITFPCIHD